MKLREAFRLTGLFAVLITAGLLATACGSNTTTSSKDPQLRVWRVGQDADSISEIAKTFLESNKSVEYTYTNKSLDRYELDALESLTTRSGPDVWSIPNDWIGDETDRLGYLPDTFFEAETKDNKDGTVKPVDYVKTIYPQGIVDQITFGDRVYGLPSAVDTLRLYVNRDVFSTALADYKRSLGDTITDEAVQPVSTLLANPPTTWSQLVEQTKYLTKRDGATITRSAIAMGTADNVNRSVDILQLLIMQNGGDITSSDRTRALFHTSVTTPSGVSVRPGEQALDFYTSFANPSKPNYSWNATMPTAIDAFGQGKVAMILGYGGTANELRVKYPRLQFEQAPVPQIAAASLQPPVNIIKFWTETVPRLADTPSIALGFMKELARNADAVSSAAGMRSPFSKTLKADTDNFLNNQILTGRGVYKKHRDQFDGAFRQMIVDVSQNGQSSSGSLDVAAQTINEILAGK